MTYSRRRWKCRWTQPCGDRTGINRRFVHETHEAHENGDGDVGRGFTKRAVIHLNQIHFLHFEIRDHSRHSRAVDCMVTDKSEKTKRPYLCSSVSICG